MGVAVLRIVGHTDGRTLTTRVRVSFRICFATASLKSCSCKDSPLADIHLLRIHVTKSIWGQRSDCVFAEDNNLADLLRIYKKFRTCRNNGAAGVPQTRHSTLTRLWKPDPRHGGIQYGFHVLSPIETRGNIGRDVLIARVTKCIPVAVNIFCGSRQFLGAFAKLRKATIKLRHVCLSTWNNLAPSGRIFVKLYIWVFFRKSAEKI